MAGAAHIAITRRIESKVWETAVGLETVSNYPTTKFSYITADITDAVGVESMFNSFRAPDILVSLPSPVLTLKLHWPHLERAKSDSFLNQINKAGFLRQPDLLKTAYLKG